MRILTRPLPTELSTAHSVTKQSVNKTGLLHWDRGLQCGRRGGQALTGAKHHGFRRFTLPGTTLTPSCPSHGLWYFSQSVQAGPQDLKISNQMGS